MSVWEVVDLEVGPDVDGKPELLSIECVDEDLSPEERKKEEERYYEEWNMCGYEMFLDEEQIAAIAEGHTIVVRGYIEYWCDYWGEWDAEFHQVEDHKTVGAPTRLLDLPALKDLRTQGIDALEILHRLRANHMQDMAEQELSDLLQNVRDQEEQDARLRTQEPELASSTPLLWLYLLENRAYYAVRGFVRRCLRKVGVAEPLWPPLLRVYTHIQKTREGRAALMVSLPGELISALRKRLTQGRKDE